MDSKWTGCWKARESGFIQRHGKEVKMMFDLEKADQFIQKQDASFV